MAAFIFGVVGAWLRSRTSMAQSHAGRAARAARDGRRAVDPVAHVDQTCSHDRQAQLLAAPHTVAMATPRPARTTFGEPVLSFTRFKQQPEHVA